MGFNVTFAPLILISGDDPGGGGGYYYRVTSAITDDYIARSKLNGFIKRQHDILIDRNGGSAFFGQS